jgi:hypothetical protein
MGYIEPGWGWEPPPTIYDKGLPYKVSHQRDDSARTVDVPSFLPIPRTYQTIFKNRFLSQRARLEFHYPGKNKQKGSDHQDAIDNQTSRSSLSNLTGRSMGARLRETVDHSLDTIGANGVIVFIPFYENPVITESQTANYVEYNPVSRSSSLFTYTGAKSRKFKVSMTFTLPHLAQHEMGISRFLRNYVTEEGDHKKAGFFKFKDMLDFYGGGAAGKLTGFQSLSREVTKIYWNLYNEDELEQNKMGAKRPGFEQSIPWSRRPWHLPSDQDYIKAVGQGSISVAEAVDSKAFIEEENRQSKLYRENAVESMLDDNIIANTDRPIDDVLDTLLFFTAVLRTSVTNKSTNPMDGPPIVRLNFGTLYQSVPCICRSYNLKWEEKAGYDVESLTPRQLIISLTLDEVRTGSGYEQATFGKRDSLTGWESVIGGVNDYTTTDPMNFIK